MTDKQKVELVDRLIREIEELSDHGMVTRLPLVGTLVQAQGIHGFKKCDVGHPVFEKGDRYILYMETLDGKQVVEVPYYPDTLKKSMKMCQIYEP